MSRVKPGGFLCHGYLGSMGVGFGTALGAQVADLEAGRRTILVTGDGSVGYSIGEFDTLVRKQLPLIVIIMNNQSWGATLHFQQWPSAPIA
jgi:acetolactate synthase-1/2/3 large subunit